MAGRSGSSVFSMQDPVCRLGWTAWLLTSLLFILFKQAMVQTSLLPSFVLPSSPVLLCAHPQRASVYYIPNGCISGTVKRSCTSRIATYGLSSHHAVINKTSWLRLEQRKLAVGRSEVTTGGRSGGGAVRWVGGDLPVLGQCWSCTRGASRWHCISIHSQSHES